jgi:hypothetical protein
MKSLSWSHFGMSSFVAIIGQYGSASSLPRNMGELLAIDVFVVVEAGESVASLTMFAALIVCDFHGWSRRLGCYEVLRPVNVSAAL